MKVNIYDKFIAKENYGKTLKVLVMLKEYHEETYYHSVDVANRALEIAQKLNYTPQQLQTIYTACLVHDVGKMLVPVELLNKKGPLSKEERNFLQLTHIQSTYKILSGTFPDEICNIAYHHHEKLNGSGYPNGLTDEMLSVDDRIIAVADITSALAMKRSYKEPLSADTCASILSGMVQKGELDGEITAISISNLYAKEKLQQLPDDEITM